MDRHLLSGNEAIARGAYEAGVKVCSAYPGTPSTEVFEELPKYKDSLYCEWAPNEKVATEVAYGASIAGVRSLCAMKHVGVNVAADPIFTAAYNGVGGGFVIVSADDPSMHSSQNEQDNRYYARSAKIPMIEPADSQECLDFIKAAYDKFHGPQFDVLSIAVWDEVEDTKKAAPELGIVWNQIINGQHIPTDLYGIQGIPHLILFGPDGTILKRGLRGEAIAEELAKYIK